MALIYRDILSANSEDFSAAMRLYEGSFPEEERETPEKIAEWLQRSTTGQLHPDRYKLVAVHDGSTMAGIVSMHYLARIFSTFLGYMAVNPAMRGRRVGTRLFELVKHTTSEAAEEDGSQPQGIYTELDKEHVDNPACETRLAIYRKWKVFPLDIHWEYPPLKRGLTPANMYLAAYFFDTNLDGVPPQRIAEASKAIYESVYARGINDSCLQRVLDSIPARR